MMSESLCNFDDEQEKTKKINKTTNKFKTFFIFRDLRKQIICNKQIHIILDIQKLTSSFFEEIGKNATHSTVCCAASSPNLGEQLKTSGNQSLFNH